jgi:uncharacterized protein YdaU (DUF1376 family)
LTETVRAEHYDQGLGWHQKRIELDGAACAARRAGHAGSQAHTLHRARTSDIGIV